MLALWASLSAALPVPPPARPLARGGPLRLGRDRRRSRSTVGLYLLDGFDSDLVIAYPLLIAASGLWFRVRLVWLTTGLAVAGYAALVPRLAALARPRSHPRHYPNIFLACLLITGFVVARQVKRIWALSTYYESRPAAADARIERGPYARPTWRTSRAPTGPVVTRRQPFPADLPRPRDVRPDLGEQVVEAGELAGRAEPGQEVELDGPAVEVAVEVDEVGLDLADLLAEGGVRADVAWPRGRPGRWPST